MLEFGFDLENDPVLVQLGENGRYLPLAESVVKSIVQELCGYAEPRSSVAVYLQPRFRPLVLLIAAHVAKFRRFSEHLDEPGRPGVQFGHIRVLEAVLKLRPAHPVLHRKVLHRLHVQLDVLEFANLRLEAANHIACVYAPLFQGLQIYEDPAGVQSDIGPVYSNEG